MARHTGMIDGVQVPSGRYVVYGKARGYVSTHRTKRAAVTALVADSTARLREGRPSDAQLYRWKDDGWLLLGQEVVDVELAEEAGE